MATIPFADLHAQYLSIMPEIDAAIADVIANSAFIRGPRVEAFEANFAAAIGTQHCVSCANGTDALYIAMIALGVKPGDEVIVPAMSWISTSETVTQAGAKVVFCDIDPVANTLDPALLADKITSRTVGIIPVHLYGNPAPMDRILEISKSYALWVIEDCAQAHLAQYKGQTVGTFGNAATFSFYPGKNLGAMGDAGGIVTNDGNLAGKMAKFARHGGLKKGDHEIEGINSRMDGLQAAILNVKLPHLADWTEKRRSIAATYGIALSSCKDLTLPTEMTDAYNVWHLYVVQSLDRCALAERLRTVGVQTSINYPRALPDLPCYEHMNHSAEDFPVAYGLAKNCLALPIYPELSLAQIRHVIEAVKNFS